MSTPGMNNNNSQTACINPPPQKHQVWIDATDTRFMAAEDKSLLVAMEATGQAAIEVGCRGGGCGRCRVRVLEGEFFAKRMSKAHIHPGDQEQGLVLACRIFARSDLRLLPEPPELRPVVQPTVSSPPE